MNMQRNYSIDLLRIISMIMVVLHIDLFGHINRLSRTTSDFSFSYTVNLYQQLCIVAVNVFVIISAWFLCDRDKIATKKIVHLYINVFWWTIVCSLIAVGLGVSPSIKDFILMVPFFGNAYDFISGYVIMYIASPYLNNMLNTLSKRDFKIIALGAFVIFSLCSCINLCGYLDVSKGYSFSWFILLYIMTSYLKHNFTPSKLLKYQKLKYLGIYLILAIIGAFLRLYHIPRLGDGNYNNPVIVIEAFSLFLFFNNMQIKGKYATRIIGFLAPLSLATFLIHANPLIEKWFSSLDFHTYLGEHTLFYAISVPSMALCVFLVCSLLEFLKNKLFNVLNIKKIELKISNIVNDSLSKIGNHG